MDVLLNQLTQPYLNSDNVLVSPTKVMLQAAAMLKNLHTMQQSDLHARLQLQLEHSVLIDQFEALRKQHEYEKTLHTSSVVGDSPNTS